MDFFVRLKYVLDLAITFAMLCVGPILVFSVYSFFMRKHSTDDASVEIIKKTPSNDDGSSVHIVEYINGERVHTDLHGYLDHDN